MKTNPTPKGKTTVVSSSIDDILASLAKLHKIEEKQRKKKIQIRNVQFA